MDKNNLKVWALAAEVIAAVSVVVTLGFLVLETRANTNASQAQTYQLLMQELNDYRALLSEAGFDQRDVEAFAVSIGPGSFTSLRVGAATAKGLAFGTDRPIAAVAAPTRKLVISRSHSRVETHDLVPPVGVHSACRVTGDGY